MGVFVMLKVSSTEVQNNFGKYLMLAQEQDVIVTRNGQDVARLVGLNDSQNGASIVSEEVLAEGYGLRKATYEEFRELTKDREERYEYIDGEIFLQPSPKGDHQWAQAKLFGMFDQFFADGICSPFVAPFDITIRRSESDINVVQPDLMLICDFKEKLGEDGYYHGVPTLVVEILSERTRRNDLLKKLNLYMHGGVKEYWIVDPKNKQISVYTFEDRDIQEYVVHTIPGKAESIVFPGLTVDLKKVFFEI
jgi:prevent-host-death family protein